MDKKKQKYYKQFFEDVAHLSASNMKLMLNYVEDESIANVNVTLLQDQVSIVHSSYREQSNMYYFRFSVFSILNQK